MFSDLNKELNNIGNSNPNLNSIGAQAPKIPPQKTINQEKNVNPTNQNNPNTINIGDWGGLLEIMDHLELGELI